MVKVKLPNTDKVHRCPRCHRIFPVYYTKFGKYQIGSNTYRLRNRLLILSPLYCGKCNTLKLPMIWSISNWKSRQKIKKWNKEM